MEKVGLNITPKEFKQLSKWAEEVYNIAVVVDYFCETQPDKEECYNLAPVVKHLHREADLLNAFFIDHEKDKFNDFERFKDFSSRNGFRRPNPIARFAADKLRNARVAAVPYRLRVAVEDHLGFVRGEH